MTVTFHLLHASSFPVIVLAVLAATEALPVLRPQLRQSRWWRSCAWFLRLWGLWAAFNIVYRLFEPLGFNNRLTFPFYFDTWDSDASWAVAARRLLPSPEFWTWSLALAALGSLFWLVCRWMMTGDTRPGKTTLALLLLVAFGFLMPLAYDCVPNGLGDLHGGKGAFGHMWVDSGNTMLYCIPLVGSANYYLRHFEEIQPKLRVSIHGADHPPGASPALYWIGRCFGARGDIHADVWRYEVGTAFFASLAVLAMFFLGWILFNSVQVGLMSAALWAVKPTSLAYNTFAPDSVYWVFYILCFALIWRVVTAGKRPYVSMIGLGVVGAILSMLNFNWPLLVAIFGVFLVLHAALTGRRAGEWMWRAAIPAAVMGVLFAWICLRYRLNYLAIFMYGLKHFSFYSLNTVYKWVMALVGGQLDVALTMGSLSAWLFWTRLPGWTRQRPLALQVAYALTILAFFFLAVVVLKDLKIEAGRIWAWTMAVPLVLVAHHLQNSEHPRFYFLMALVLGLLQYYAMGVMLVSCG